MTEATIFALASGRPPAAIAVIRLSGPAVRATVTAMTGRLPPPRRMTSTRIVDPATRTVIDHALAVWFAAPASATGEDAAEFHVHGGTAVVAAMLRCLGAQPGLRLAEPGEFTRRAFDNARLDLTQVEGLADLMAAGTETQRLQALTQATGGLRQRAERWRATILAALANSVALLDFAEEQSDVVVASDAATTASLRALRGDVAAHLADSARGERVRDGLTVAVVGAPNVGKSSLFNILAGSDAAIVSPVAGTTRDPIEVALDLDGCAVTLIDTAGLRDDVADPVEREGMARARARAASAALVLHIATEPPAEPLGQVVINKIALSGAQAGMHSGRLHVSAATGEGVEIFRNWLAAWATAALRSGDPALVTRERQRLALASLVEALDDVDHQPDPVLHAEALQAAAQSLARLTGRVGIEDVLDELYANFCIGK